MQGVPAVDAEVVCTPDQKGDLIVVVSSDRMGTGNDELGKVLIKGFIYTTEGSDSIEDLKSLEAQGVEILTCGTCLDYYHLKDKLVVGGVTNMYSIVESMAEAGKIIRP